MGTRRQFLDWVSSASGGVPVWLCTVHAAPRLATENEKRFTAATIYFLLRTPDAAAAEFTARMIADEQGWSVDQVVECRAVTRWTVPVSLTKEFKSARSLGEAFLEEPELRSAAG